MEKVIIALVLLPSFVLFVFAITVSFHMELKMFWHWLTKKVWRW